MNIRDLKYLVAVAELKNFRLAAERCFVSQPTLSMQLKKLEDEFGVQCFERTNKKVMITLAGAKLVAQAQLVLNELDQLCKIAENTRDPLAGDFRLGIIPTIGPFLLPKVLQEVKHNLPKLELIIVEDKTNEIVKMLQTGSLDAIILALPMPDLINQFVISELFEEPFFLAIANDHSFVKKAKVRIKDIEKEPLLLLTDGHCLRDQALDVCRFIGVKERQGFQTTSLDTLTRLVEAGAGVTLLPEMAASKCHADIAIKPFVRPVPTRKIGMVWRKNSVRKHCCENIFDYLHKKK
jgi:LysR family transcriptional regulator, hydrogen peroxide-inducible genes activator